MYGGATSISSWRRARTSSFYSDEQGAVVLPARLRTRERSLPRRRFRPARSACVAGTCTIRAWACPPIGRRAGALRARARSRGTSSGSLKTISPSRRAHAGLAVSLHARHPEHLPRATAGSRAASSSAISSNRACASMDTMFAEALGDARSVPERLSPGDPRWIPLCVDRISGGLTRGAPNVKERRLDRDALHRASLPLGLQLPRRRLAARGAGSARSRARVPGPGADGPRRRLRLARIRARGRARLGFAPSPVPR